LKNAGSLRSARIRGEGKRLAQTVVRKDSEYGDATRKAGRLLRELWPNGIPVDAYDSALLVVRILDKVCRIANGCEGNPAAKRDAWSDIGGYGLLGVVNGGEAG
jgi:hypothetical protein